MKKLRIILPSLMLTSILWAQNFMNEPLFYESSDKFDFSSLLEAYKNNNSDMERMKIKYEASKISGEQNKLKYTPKVTVSSGRSNIEFDSEDGASVSFAPTASVTVPDANNLGVSASLPSKISSDGYTLEGADVKVGADIFTAAAVERQVSKIENARSLLTAKRNLRKQELAVEAAFLNELNSLYEKASEVLKNREKYLEKLVAFQTVKVQGYGTSSPKYKIALLEKDSAYNNCSKAYRELQSLIEDFSIRCNVDLKYLIADIPEVELIKFEDFSEGEFAQIESSLYAQEIGDLKRKANKTWSLTGNVLYDYDNNVAKGYEAHSLGAGLEGSWKGVGLGLGFTVPVTQDGNPALSFNVSWDPMSWKSTKLSLQGNALDVQLEQLDIDDAYTKYKETKRAYEKKAEDLEWEYNLLKEQAVYYSNMQSEMRTAYRKGLISESDYISAENQCLNIKISMLKNLINRQKFNIEVKQLFTGDEDE